MRYNQTLMLIATIGSFILLTLLLFFPLPDKNAQTFLALASFVMGFYFGSSVSTKPQPTTTTPPATMSDVINQAIIDATTKK